MEYRFDLSPYFKSSNIVRVNNNLVPQGFTSDRRTILDTTSKMSEIINEIGEASARAQGLNKPVTTALKLRNSDHAIYLMGDNTAKGGRIDGFLKVGTKNLYVFDENGETKQVSTPCVLDFYVHESKQRTGLGKQLFQTMLEREHFVPVKMAIDRPSDKLLGFLKKYYGLERKIPQMNNFVIYDGFFNVKPSQSQQLNDGGGGADRRMQITASPNTALFGPHFIADEHKKRQNHIQQNSPHLSVMQNSPMGRFGARRPTCSMAEIIHNSPTPIADEPKSPYNQPNSNNNYKQFTQNGVYGNLNKSNGHHHDGGGGGGGVGVIVDDEDEEIKIEIEHDNLNNIIHNINDIKLSDCNRHHHHHHHRNDKEAEEQRENESTVVVVEQPSAVVQTPIEKPTYFHLSKQHTGLKNISFNVGAAVSPTDKMEFNQMEPESFGLLKINRPLPSPIPKWQQQQPQQQHQKLNHQPPLPITTATLSPNNIDNTDAVSMVSSEGFTEQGYFDLKFYHNKLW